MGLILFIIILAIFLFLIEKITNKLLGIEKKKISETAGKNVDRWRKNITLVVFLCSLPFAKNTSGSKLYWILLFVLSLGSQSFLEWKYLKGPKQYITTLIYLIISILIIYYIEYFFPLLRWRQFF